MPSLATPTTFSIILIDPLLAPVVVDAVLPHSIAD